MTTKEQKLYSFYSQCITKGYTDMTDDTQSLKAKVIASDLGLKYGNIVAFYEQAKKVFELEEDRKKVEAEKATIEAIRTSVAGELVLTLRYDLNDTNYIEVYRRPDGSVYCTHDGKETKFEGAPDIQVNKGSVLSYTYHPSKTIFTGASSGGIAMGGFHQTEAYTTEKVSGTGKGDIHAKSGDMNIWVKYIDFSDATDYAFRRDETYKSLSHRKRIVCFDANTSRLSKDIMGMAMQSGAGYQDILSKASMANDMMKLSMGEIQKIAAFINAVIEGNYPATDEEYYEKAITLSDSTKSDDLLEAVQIFRKISDYKDSANIADITQKKYEETLQFEKEQKILQKEREAKKHKKILIIATPVIIAIIIGLTIASNKAKKEAAYNAAIQMEKDGEYDEAIKTFEALDGYKDSIDMIKECHYIQALEVIDRLDLDNPNKMAEVVYLWGPYELNKDVQKIAGAYEFFKSSSYKQAQETLTALGDYKDSNALLEMLENDHKAVITMYSSFKDAMPLVKALPDNDKLKESLSNIIAMYEPYIGTFYWMNSQNMKFDSDFRFITKYFGALMWFQPQVNVPLDGKMVPYPLVILDGKNHSLLSNLDFDGLKATGNIEELIDIKVSLENGVVLVDMYYKSGNEMKLGDTFYACSDDTQSKKIGEDYYKSQKERIKHDA